MRSLLTGELNARAACALAQLSNSLYRILPMADLEARLAVLEEQVAQNGQGTRKEDKHTPNKDLTDPSADGMELIEVDQPTGSMESAQEEDTPQSMIDGSGEGEELR
jgi:hypothetical protein